MMVTDDEFLDFLEAAHFEDSQIHQGSVIDPSQVARTAGLDVTVVHACIEILISRGLGHASQDDSNGFQIDTARVHFILRARRRSASKPEQGSVYNIHVTNSTIAALSAGEHAGASGVTNVPARGAMSSQSTPHPARATQVAAAQSAQDLQERGPAIDFAILTAIEVERKAVCAAFGLTNHHKVKREGRTYWRGTLPLKNGQHYEILIAQPRDMGQVEAALLATDVIKHWQPSAALLVGIAASTNKDVKLGDVVIGRSVYYYEHGKVTPDGTKLQPEMIPADPALLDAVVTLDWEETVPGRPDKSEVQPKRHLGVIASGEKVIASAAARNDMTAPSRKILALEMEGYGFSRAVWQNFERVRHLDVRGICDDADETKGDDWHKYAAAAVAGFVKHFLLDRPIEPKARLFPRPAHGQASSYSPVVGSLGSVGDASTPRDGQKGISDDAGKNQPLHYYVYLSRSKVDMLWPQISQNSAHSSLSLELKTQIIVDYIRNAGLVGTSVNPGVYIEGTINARVAVVEERALFQSCSRQPGEPIVGLNCSSRHLLGAQSYDKQDPYTNNGEDSSSLLTDIAALLRVLSHMSQEDENLGQYKDRRQNLELHERESIWRKMGRQLTRKMRPFWPTSASKDSAIKVAAHESSSVVEENRQHEDVGERHRLLFRQFFGVTIGGTAQRYRFFAKVLLHGEYGGIPMVLATPIYIALE